MIRALTLIFLVGLLVPGANAQPLASETDALWYEIAAKTPPVPEWLLADLPAKCLLLEDGRVVTDGPLGSAAAAARERELEHAAQDPNFARTPRDVSLYAANGELLKRLPGGIAYTPDLFNPAFQLVIEEAIAAGWDRRSYADGYSDQGYLAYLGPGNKVLFYYDVLAGKKVETPMQRARSFSWINSHRLQKIAEAQTELGLR